MIWIIGMLISITAIPCIMYALAYCDSLKENYIDDKVLRIEEKFGSHTDFADKLTRNGIMTPNETRQMFGLSRNAVNKTSKTNCPNCGAPIDIHAEKCEYCDTPWLP